VKANFQQTFTSHVAGTGGHPNKDGMIKETIRQAQSLNAHNIYVSPFFDNMTKALRKDLEKRFKTLGITFHVDSSLKDYEYEVR
jgi:hypothetical protein